MLAVTVYNTKKGTQEIKIVKNLSNIIFDKSKIQFKDEEENTYFTYPSKNLTEIQEVTKISGTYFYTVELEYTAFKMVDIYGTTIMSSEPVEVPNAWGVMFNVVMKLENGTTGIIKTYIATAV